MKHTPGPWKTCLNEPFLAIPRHAIKTDNDVERPIATLWVGGGTKGKPTQLANARLIAAAPELLKILKDWERNIPRMKDSTPGEDSLRARALRAIAKAEGR